MLAFCRPGLRKGTDTNRVCLEQLGEQRMRSTATQEMRLRLENPILGHLFLRQTGLTLEQGKEIQGQRAQRCEQMTFYDLNCVRQR